MDPKPLLLKQLRLTPSRNASCLKPNLLQTAEAHSPVGIAWQNGWVACEPKVALPLLGHPAGVNPQPPALLRHENLNFQN